MDTDQHNGREDEMVHIELWQAPYRAPDFKPDGSLVTDADDIEVLI